MYTFMFVLLFVIVGTTTSYAMWGNTCQYYGNTKECVVFCQATVGGVMVSYSYPCQSKLVDFEDIKVTSIQGLPLSIRDFQSARQSADSILERAVVHRRSSSYSATAGTGTEAGASAGAYGGKEQTVSKNRV